MRPGTNTPTIKLAKMDNTAGTRDLSIASYIKAATSVSINFAFVTED